MTGVITSDGLEHIAAYQHKSGACSFLDRLLDPIWTWLTDLLPLWLTPNMITLIGGTFCGVAYVVSWYYSPNFDQPLPGWVFLLNGCCTIAYYTLDCMDGKQARRTGTSSPLGDLFDHGIDCICQLSHASILGACFMIRGPYEYLLFQSSIQFAFFLAHWQKYHTGVLPTGTRNVGVTEGGYGLAIIATANAFFDREAFWTHKLDSFLPSFFATTLPKTRMMELEIRQLVLVVWVFTWGVVVCKSGASVYRNVDNTAERLSAFSKLTSPLLLGVLPLFLPSDLMHSETRYIAVALGHAYTLITIKVIVFCMAKMTFATIDGDVLPLIILCVWLRFYNNKVVGWGMIDDDLMMRALCLWQTCRLLVWVRAAILQICVKLGIDCFTIKEKTP